MVTYVDLHCHLVFSTKKRRTTIRDVCRPRLHAYIGATLKDLDTVPLGVGGTTDHIHVLASIRSTQLVADLVREVKQASTGWI